VHQITYSDAKGGFVQFKQKQKDPNVLTNGDKTNAKKMLLDLAYWYIVGKYGVEMRYMTTSIAQMDKSRDMMVALGINLDDALSCFPHNFNSLADALSWRCSVSNPNVVLLEQFARDWWAQK
jgi:hypothetical protein